MFWTIGIVPLLMASIFMVDRPVLWVYSKPPQTRFNERIGFIVQDSIMIYHLNVQNSTTMLPQKKIYMLSTHPSHQSCSSHLFILCQYYKDIKLNTYRS
jgi:hypothetical protein